MGKGNRNRTGKDDGLLTGTSSPAKTKKSRPRKPLPKWLVPLISIVLVVAIVAGVVLFAMGRNGFFKRMNILVKSQTSGKYSINQQMAYFLVWNYYYEQAAETWDYYNSLYSNMASYFTGASSKLDYCWGMAMTAAQNKLNTTVSSSTLLQSYVALCDYGQRNNLQLTKTEKEDAITNMYQVLRSRAYDYYDYLSDHGYSVTPANVYYGNYLEFGRWWKTVFGSDFKESDMEKATVVLALSNKVLAQWQNDTWEATDAKAELLANPDRYYKTDYVTYSTTDAALAALLAGIGSEDQLKETVTNYYIENNYLELYNKYATGKVDEADAVLDNLKGKTTVAEQQAALNLYELTLTEYTEGDETLDEKIAAWLFDDARNGFDTTQIKLDDGIAVVTVEGTDPVEDPGEEPGEAPVDPGEAPAADPAEEPAAETPKKIKAAIKKIDYVALDEEGMTKLKNTVRLAMGLTDDDTLAIYLSPAEDAADFAEQLKAENADLDTLLATATTVNDFIETEEGVPEIVRSAVFALGVKVGEVLTETDDAKDAKVYVIYVKDLKDPIPAETDGEGNETAPAVPARASVAYKIFSEPMSTVATELQDGAEEEIGKISDSTATYLKPAAVKAQEMLDQLGKSYNKTLFMTNKSATTQTDVRADNKPEGIPDEVYQAALQMEVDEAKLADVADSTAKYLIYISERTDTGLTVLYRKVETYETDTYSEWLFGTAAVQNGQYVSGVAEGDSKVIEKDADEEGGDKTYSFYLVENTPMYLDTDQVVRGGYLTFTGENAQKRAEDAKNALAGKTGYDLLKALAAIESDAAAVASNSIKKDSVTSTTVSEWLFDPARTANEIAVLEEGGAYYVVVFESQMEAWENSAKENASSDGSTEWVQKLIADGGYKVSEKALKKIKDVEDKPADTTETTAE